MADGGHFECGLYLKLLCAESRRIFFGHYLDPYRWCGTKIGVLVNISICSYIGGNLDRPNKEEISHDIIREYYIIYDIIRLMEKMQV